MSLIVSEKSGSSIPMLEPGAYTAICYALVDLGEQYSEVYKKTQPKVLIMWEIPGETFTDADGNVQSRTLSQRYTMSLNEKSSLRRDLASWRGRDFTEAELAAFDLHNILGAPCLLNVIQKDNNGKMYTNVASIMRLPKDMPKPSGRMERIAFDLDKDDLSIMERLPEWVQNNIRQSETYKERVAGMGEGAAAVDEASEAIEFVDVEGENLPF